MGGRGDGAMGRKGESTGGQCLAPRPKVGASATGALPHPEKLLACLTTLKTADGGYINEPGQSAGLTPPTAAVITLQAELGVPVDQQAVDWLLARHLPTGGFAAMPSLPLADLLSTATALHALRRAGANIDPIREPCLRFVLGMWDRGGFRGQQFDDVRDCEYTFYGLLALGELSSEHGNRDTELGIIG